MTHHGASKLGGCIRVGPMSVTMMKVKTVAALLSIALRTNIKMSAAEKLLAA